MPVAAIGGLVLLAVLVGGLVALGIVRCRRRAGAPASRLLLVLPDGGLPVETIDAVARIAATGRSTVVPTVLLTTPCRIAVDAPRPDAAEAAFELLSAVEGRLRRAGARVDSRVATGRTVRHALLRAVAEIPHQRTLVPAGTEHGGLGPRDVAWCREHLPGELLVIDPPAAEGEAAADAGASEGPSPRQRRGSRSLLERNG